MTEDEYVQSIVAKYQVATGPNSPAETAGQALYPLLAQWAGQWLHGVTFSGSYAKGTAIGGATDVDLFISLRSNLNMNLKEIYESLAYYMDKRGYLVDKRNVSMRIYYQGVKVDLVPARRQRPNSNYHSLYVRRRDTWQQTNIAIHINKVQNSNRTTEIKALKIWKHRHGIDWPSFYLELVVLRALSGTRYGRPGRNVINTLLWIQKNLENAQFPDPANTNNSISADLTIREKKSIAHVAGQSAVKPDWRQIIW